MTNRTAALLGACALTGLAACTDPTRLAEDPTVTSDVAVAGVKADRVWPGTTPRRNSSRLVS